MNRMHSIYSIGQSSVYTGVDSSKLPKIALYFKTLANLATLIILHFAYLIGLVHLQKRLKRESMWNTPIADWITTKTY